MKSVAGSTEREGEIKEERTGSNWERMECEEWDKGEWKRRRRGKRMGNGEKEWSVRDGRMENGREERRGKRMGNGKWRERMECEGWENQDGREVREESK